MQVEIASARRGISLSLITDGVTVGFGLWTVVSTLTTIAGGSPRHWLNAGVLFVCAALGISALPRFRSRWLISYLADTWASEPPARLGSRLLLRTAIFVTTALAIALWFWLRRSPYVWGAIVLCCAVASYSGARRDVIARGPADAPLTLAAWQMPVVHGLALVCATFTLLSVRPRTDDPFYINMSISVADYPNAPLLALRTMHGTSPVGLQLQTMFPPYRAHSFESLGGYLSYLTGIEAIKIVHFGLATFFAWFAVFAIARFFRVVAPWLWIVALVVTLSYYFIEGSAGRGYANQAFVRMFHGKGALLTAGVPLILAYGVRFGLRPSGWRFALLALAQICVMGMSSTGIWLAPILAMLAVVAASPTLRSMPLACLRCALSSGYVLMVGLWVRSQMGADRRGAVESASASLGSVAEHGLSRLGYVMPDVLGDERTALVLLGTIGLACVVAQYALVLRLLALLGLFTSAILANPWLADLVASSVTGALTYERLFWLLPIPLAWGLCASGIAELTRRRLGVVGASLVFTLIVSAFYAVVPARYVVSKANDTSIVFPPALKIWDRPRRVAQALCEHSPRGTTVLASQSVSRGLATVHDCGYPLIAGMRWMSGPIGEIRIRGRLQKYVSKPGDVSREDTRWFVDQLNRFAVATVAMAPPAMRNRRVKAMLYRAGFAKIGVVERNHIWSRKIPKDRHANL